MQKGSYVIRKKYGGDILFKVEKVLKDVVILKGVYIRLVATAPIKDLILITEPELNYYNKMFLDKSINIKKGYKFNKNHITGKILHIDSDLEYLKKCNRVYQELGLYSVCVLIDAQNIYKYVVDLVKAYNIDIVVITGHDSYNKKGIDDLNNYMSTKYYIKAVKELRKYYSKNDLYIFAGACGSHFEALMAAGATAASSPARVNIDAYDPAICAVKAATTPFNQIISFDSIWEHSLTKKAGISGLENYGHMRILRL